MDRPNSAKPMGDDGDRRRGVLRWLVREVMGIVLVILSLFLPAGRWDWALAWALVAIYALWTTATAVIAIPRSPEMLAERARGRTGGGASWDVVILSIMGLITVVKHLVAGFDERFGWSVQIPLAVQIGAGVLAASAYGLLTWSMASNVFFSCVVRLQRDRDHQVVTQGPYRYVRHPGYLGTLLFELVSPIMLGSLWALIAGGAAAVLTILRTTSEDRTLRAELEGYEAYAQRVRYRLIPGIW